MGNSAKQNGRWSNLAVVALVVLFSGLGMWGLLRDGTAQVVGNAMIAFHADVESNGIVAATANARMTRDLSEHWRPWGTDLARLEEVMAYSFLASWFMALFLGWLRTKGLPALRQSIAQGRTLAADHAALLLASLNPIATADRSFGMNGARMRAGTTEAMLPLA